MIITNITSYFTKDKGAYFVKIDTDEGVSGLGECSPMNVRGNCEIIEDYIKPQLIGQDPLNIVKIEEAVTKKNYKFAGQLSAMAFSGVEIALWDLKGKYLNLPVYSLLGGKCREVIEYYGSSMSRDLSPEEEALKVKKAVDEFGFKAVKIKVGARMGNSTGVIDYEGDIEKVKALRQVLGDKIKIMIDGNSSFTYFQAEQLFSKIKEYDIYVFEEPCPYFDIDSYVKLAQRISVPINIGEQDWNIFTIKEFIAREACHISAVDVTKCGGFSNARRVAALCKAFGILYAPHNTTRGIGLFATAHLVASTPECAFYQEYSIQGLGDREKYLLNRPVPKNGTTMVPEAPGLGVEMDLERMEAEMTVVR